MSDLISRQAAIDAVRNYLLECQIEDGDYHADGIMYELDCLPSVQPEITKKDVEEYCRKRCLTVITNDLFHKLTAGRRTDE